MSLRRLHLADLCCLSYLAASALLLGLTGAGTPGRLLLYVAGIAVCGLVAFGAASARTSISWRVAAALYPIVVVAFTWGELRLLIPAVQGDDYWATGWAVRADLALFGVHPTAAIQGLHRPWLDETMAWIYLSYYLFLGVPLLLVLRRRLDEARATAGAIALGYTINFAFFVAVPIKSPPQILETWPQLLPESFGGWLAADALRALQNAESVAGAAFPSSHVAGAVICALAARRWLPALGAMLLPLALGVAVATVYLGYHHAIDSIAGIVWGAGAWLGALAILRRRDRLPPEIR